MSVAPHVRQRRYFRHKRLLKLGYADYREYLRSPHWRQLRERFSESDQPQACICGETEDLELHHKTYERLGEELLDDLVWLCGRCHGMTHVLEARGDMDLALTGFTSDERAEHFRAQQAPVRAKAISEFASAQRRETALNRYANSISSRVREAVKACVRRDIDIREELDAIEVPLREIERKLRSHLVEP